MVFSGPLLVWQLPSYKIWESHHLNTKNECLDICTFCALGEFSNFICTLYYQHYCTMLIRGIAVWKRFELPAIWTSSYTVALVSRGWTTNVVLWTIIPRRMSLCYNNRGILAPQHCAKSRIGATATHNFLFKIALSMAQWLLSWGQNDSKIVDLLSFLLLVGYHVTLTLRWIIITLNQLNNNVIYEEVNMDYKYI